MYNLLSMPDKEQFKSDVINASYEIIKKEGLNTLTVRKLASYLEHSASRVYKDFGSKRAIITLLSEDIASRICRRIERYQTLSTIEERFFVTIHETMLFYVEEPWAVQVIMAVRFGNLGKEVPPSHKKLTQTIRTQLIELGIGEQKLEDTFNVVRCLIVGTLSLLRDESTECEKKRAVRIVDEGMRLLIAGSKNVC